MKQLWSNVIEWIELKRRRRRRKHTIHVYGNFQFDSLKLSDWDSLMDMKKYPKEYLDVLCMICEVLKCKLEYSHFDKGPNGQYYRWVIILKDPNGEPISYGNADIRVGESDTKSKIRAVAMLIKRLKSGYPKCNLPSFTSLSELRMKLLLMGLIHNRTN